MNYETFTKLVLKAKVNKTYTLPENFRYKKMNIDKQGDEYSWGIERNFNVTGMVGWVYPMASTSYVKFFKTEAGAKRNLINWIKFCFEKD
jgi:hypothetical protein